MDFIDSEIEAYAEKYTSAESALLHALNRETHQKVLQPRMLSGHLQGRVLSMIAHMIRPNRILEIGTYTGYSALCFAEGMKPDGHIDTIDRNEELEPIFTKYAEQAGLSDKITLHTGNALEIIPKLNHRYDLVFIDADKTNYPAYYRLVFEKIPVGGYILADNVLWSGKVLDAEELKNDPDTHALSVFNEMVLRDDRVENVLLPVRDGLMLIRKNKN